MLYSQGSGISQEQLGSFGGNTLLTLISIGQNRSSQLHIEKQWKKKQDMQVFELVQNDIIRKNILRRFNKTAIDDQHHSLAAKQDQIGKLQLASNSDYKLFTLSAKPPVSKHTILLTVLSKFITTKSSSKNNLSLFLKTNQPTNHRKTISYCKSSIRNNYLA